MIKTISEAFEPKVDIELALKHGLIEEEYEKILSILGRVPTYTELGIYSVMWSEHCSYKNSIAELKKLPRSGERLLVKAGEENAGLVDIGNGYAIAFKIESHNHPSAVEPYQGAATGVGGIMRDIFTMGARPIAALNSLRFGDLANPRTRYLLKGVVKGIGDYGNSFGVPTIAGDVYFDECYSENPLVNAMAVGIVKHDEIARAIAKGPGNIVMIVGSSTGRDGIHGATFASEEISDESESKRPSVQVGDPFTEKLLLEATLEVIRAGYVVGIQDLGAAGITCSASEMSAKGSCEMEIELDRVPIREKEMTGYEIMLSESQERMLLIVLPSHEQDVRQVFEKWDLRCQTIGKLKEGNALRVNYKGERIAEVPAQSLVLGGDAPVYYRESKEPEYIQHLRKFDPNSLPEPTDYNESLLKLLESPNICSRRWIISQYDTMVRTNTIIDVIGDAAVIRLKEFEKALAVKTDCNARYVFLNPYKGAQIAVAESARNVVCVGARPLAITNCLNFGNPYKPDIYWQFKESVRGIADACNVLNTPVTSGNVSFYNESPDGSIYPTPIIGMLGEINDVSKVISADFKNKGDIVLLLGQTIGDIGGSEYLKVIHGKVCGDAPSIDLYIEKRLHEACLEMINLSIVKSAHDLSEGGLAVALAECSLFAFAKGKSLGASISIPRPMRTDFALFSEDQSRILVTASETNLPKIKEISQRHQVTVRMLGEVIQDRIEVREKINLSVREASIAYYGSLERKVGVSS
ncbi:MAG: phosphoribosylformylglycinamidine synthase subunit PurL [Ignavibacteria bacterium]|nr:phosphoribosylformylglycinamidine synthase subunit PurL [Ignavibacteria bacterium]